MLLNALTEVLNITNFLTEGSKVAFLYIDYPPLYKKRMILLWGSNTQLDCTKFFFRKMREKINNADVEAAR